MGLRWVRKHSCLGWWRDDKIGMSRIICILFSIIFASQDLKMKTLWSEIKNFWAQHTKKPLKMHCPKLLQNFTHSAFHTKTKSLNFSFQTFNWLTWLIDCNWNIWTLVNFVTKIVLKTSCHPPLHEINFLKKSASFMITLNWCCL